MRSVPCDATTSSPNGKIAAEQQRSVRQRLDGESAARGRKSLSLFSDSAVILEAGHQVAVVAKRFVLGPTAAAKRRAEAHARHAFPHTLQVQITVDIERSFVDHRHDVLCRWLLPRAAVTAVAQRSARAPFDDLPYLGLGAFVRDTPGIAAPFKELVRGSGAFADVDTEVAIPLHVDVDAGIVEYFFSLMVSSRAQVARVRSMQTDGNTRNSTPRG